MLKYFLNQEERDIFLLIEQAGRLLKEDPRLIINETIYNSRISQATERLRSYSGPKKETLEKALDSVS